VDRTFARASDPPPARRARVVDLLRVPVLVLDSSGAAVEANPAMLALLGNRPMGWRGVAWLDLFTAEPGLDHLRAVVERAETGRDLHVEWTGPAGNDRTRSLHVVAVPELVDGSLERIVVTIVDVTGERARLATLTRLATLDSLTGLQNRARFDDLVDHAVEARRFDGRFSAIVFVDVDDLKATNDRYGHDAGDDLLRTVAARIAGATSGTDVSARLGGDEFGVLRELLDDPDEALALAEHIRSAVLQPYDGPGGCSVSVGVAVADGRLPGAEVLRRADAAMYRAKRAHHESIDSTAEAAVRLARWRAGLSDAARRELLEALHCEAASATAVLADLLAADIAGDVTGTSPGSHGLHARPRNA
jgi:diguanylate cyclase (GGDEF)-like protein/PAS domain S-box-containing protein